MRANEKPQQNVKAVRVELYGCLEAPRVDVEGDGAKHFHAIQKQNLVLSFAVSVRSISLLFHPKPDGYDMGASETVAVKSGKATVQKKKVSE